MKMLLSATIAYHGQVGAWDEIGLIAAGVLVAAILLVVLLRGRRFEPEYEEDETKMPAGDMTDEE